MDIFGKDPFEEVEDVFSESIWSIPSEEQKLKVPSPESSPVPQTQTQPQQVPFPQTQPQSPQSATSHPAQIPWQQQVPVMIPQVVPQIPYPPVVSPYFYQDVGVQQISALRPEQLRRKKEEAEGAGKKKEEKKKASYLLNFRLGNEFYGVDVESIREVVRAGKITPVPNTHYHILGIMNLRGRIIPVISLRRFFGMEDISIDRKSKILVVEDEDGNQTGVLVDDVNEVFLYYDEELESITTIKFSGSRYAKGVLKKDDNPIVVIDIREIIIESTSGLSL